jgi:hypothetical protein
MDLRCGKQMLALREIYQTNQTSDFDPFAFVAERLGKHVCSLFVRVAITQHAHFSCEDVAGPANVDFMRSSKVSHSGISPSFEHLDGCLIIFVKVHFDVHFFYSFVVFVGDDVGDCPTDDVTTESLFVVSR